jgi:hypothetical protein
MSGDQPLPHAVRAEVQNVVWAAFYYRDDFKSLMLGAGVPAAIYNRYDDPGTAKVKIARAVLDELQELGPPGWRIQRKIAAELCAMRRPANGVADVKAGMAALDQLRRAALGGEHHRRHRAGGGRRAQGACGAATEADRGSAGATG